jgi:hypothetical protein
LPPLPGGGADHAARLGKIVFDRTEAAQILEIVDVDVPVVDLVAALAQEIADHVLARPLGAAGRGDRNEIAGGRKLGIEASVDGIQDLLLRIGNHAAAPIEDFRGRESGHSSLSQPPGYCTK